MIVIGGRRLCLNHKGQTEVGQVRRFRAAEHVDMVTELHCLVLMMEIMMINRNKRQLMIAEEGHFGS